VSASSAGTAHGAAAGAGIHPTAIVEAGAEIGPGVQIGPYAVIGPRVRLGAGSRIGAHAVISGDTVIGRDNRIHSFASLGDAPQHLAYRDEPTRVVIGDRNVIREFVTVNRGTAAGGGVTTIGDENYLMAYAHIAHDCRLGSRIIMANNASLSGHVEIGDGANLAGFAKVHQFCRIGAYSMIAADAVCLQDVPPFVLVQGAPAEPRGINTVGLRRRNVRAESIAELKRAFRAVFREGLPLKAAIAGLESGAFASDEVRVLAEFLKSLSKRRLAR
jgi:UDP-N-acetylglucosamine acyltransferase